MSRSRRDDTVHASSPAQRRARDPDASESLPLPPYEPPSCPLTANAKRTLESLSANLDTSKYEKHLKAAIQNVTNSAVEPSDRLHNRLKRVKHQAEKRRQLGKENEEKTDLELEEEEYAEDLEKKVEALTTKAEKALRELIDFSDELALRDHLLKQVNENIPAPNTNSAGSRRRTRRARNGDSDDDDDDGEADDYEEDEADTMDPSVLSALESLNKLKEEYSTSYASKTKRAK